MAVHAAIASTGDAAISLVPAPGDVRQNALESGADIFIFAEQENVVLVGGAVVDFSVPGIYDQLGDYSPSVIPAGTAVNSYLLHQDSPAATTIKLSGTVTFDEEILGIVASDVNLDATDAPLGLAGTSYPTGLDLRGIEPNLNPDTVQVMADRRTLRVHFRTNTVLDQLRVITSAAPFDFEGECDCDHPTVIDEDGPILGGSWLQFDNGLTGFGLDVDAVHAIDALRAEMTQFDGRDRLLHESPWADFARRANIAENALEFLRSGEGDETANSLARATFEEEWNAVLAEVDRLDERREELHDLARRLKTVRTTTWFREYRQAIRQRIQKAKKAGVDGASPLMKSLEGLELWLRGQIETEALGRFAGGNRAHPVISILLDVYGIFQNAESIFEDLNRDDIIEFFDPKARDLAEAEGALLLLLNQYEHHLNCREICLHRLERAWRQVNGG